MAVSREAIESLPMRKRRQQSSQTVDTFVQGQAPSDQPTRAARVVEGIFNFSGKAIDYAAKSEASKIEMDKVTQQQRALQGLDPTDDATNAGIRAYQVVNMRDQVLETNSELAQKIRDNPDMTDEEYEIATRESYAHLLEQYQPDPQLSQALSNKLQESQTQIHQIRSAVQREHREWQKQESFNTSIEEYREAAGTPQELAHLINDGQLKNEADALGISEEQYRTGLIKFAEMDASQGDGRILQALEGQEWASRDPRIDRAREKYEQWAAQEYAVEIGTQWGKIQEGWKTRRASWAQTEESIRRVNDKFPGAITANQVASLRQRAAVQHKKDSGNAAFLRRVFESENSDDPIRVGANPLVTDEKRDYFIKTTSEQIDSVARNKQATGEFTAEQAQSYALTQKLALGRKHSVEMPGIKDITNNVAMTDPQDWGGEGVPDHLMAGLVNINAMNESDIERYGKDERTKNYMRNFQRFSNQALPDRQAAERAYRSVNSQVNMPSDVRAEFRSSVADSIDSELDRSVFQAIGDFITGDVGGSEVPDGLRLRMISGAQLEADAIIDGGGSDIEEVAKISAKRERNKYTILDGFGYITRETSQLLYDTRYRDEGGQVRALSEKDITPAFEQFFNENRETFVRESSYGDDLQPNQVYYETTTGGLVTVYDSRGDVLSPGPVQLNRIAKRYIEQESAQRAGEAMRDRSLDTWESGSSGQVPEERRRGTVEFEVLAPGATGSITSD